MKHAAAMGAAALVLTLGADAATTPVERVVVSDRGDLYLVAPANGSRDRFTRTSEIEAEPALSPDGTRVAFVRDGRILLLPTREAGTARTIGTPGSSSPSWSPDGARLVVSTSAGLAVVDAATGAATALPGGERGHHPAWSPDGRAVAVAPDGDLWLLPAAGGTPSPLVADPAEDSEPAWSPDGTRIAFVRGAVPARDVWTTPARGGSPAPLVATAADEFAPVFAPDGQRIAFARANAVFLLSVDGAGVRRLGPGVDPSWGRIPAPAPPPPPPPDELLPDLDQRAPRGLTIDGRPGAWKLGFTSATDNIGAGAVWIRGTRRLGERLMTANQVIALKTGGTRVIRDVGRIRFTISSAHRHWHLLRFQAYELRRLDDYGLLVRDRKSGFCLADHYGTARKRVQNFRPPRFLDKCGQGRPELRAVEQGTSPGYTDRYPAHFHGQNVDVTGVPAGTYVLVHRADPLGRLRERTRANNAASVRIRLSWPDGRSEAPKVAVLRRCENRERC